MKLPLRVTLVALLLISNLPAQEKAQRRSQAIERGVSLLLEMQENYRKDRRVGRLPADELKPWQEKEAQRLKELRSAGDGAEWPYEGVYRVRGAVPSGYRVGGTAITCTALLLAPGLDKSPERRQALDRALGFMLASIDEDPQLEAGPKRGYDVRGWAHSYLLDYLLHARSRGILGDHALRVEKAIAHLIHCLGLNQTRHGGWNYANDSLSPFMTGATLLTLYRAQADGFTVPALMVERALAALEVARGANDAYPYSGLGTRGATLAAGSSARSAVAELALFRAGRSDAEHLCRSVDLFFSHWQELLKRKSQQGTHVGRYGIAPYYFFFGHAYAALAIEQLPEAMRNPRRAAMEELLWKDAGGRRLLERPHLSSKLCLWNLDGPALSPRSGDGCDSRLDSRSRGSTRSLEAPALINPPPRSTRAQFSAT